MLKHVQKPTSADLEIHSNIRNVSFLVLFCAGIVDLRAAHRFCVPLNPAPRLPLALLIELAETELPLATPHSHHHRRSRRRAAITHVRDKGPARSLRTSPSSLMAYFDARKSRKERLHSQSSRSRGRTGCTKYCIFGTQRLFLSKYLLWPRSMNIQRHILTPYDKVYPLFTVIPLLILPLRT